jgi:hypothetical protein
MFALQVLPQSMPVGEEVTVPVPLPTVATVSVYVVCVGCVPNVAVTLRAADMLTVQVPVPVQAPLHPVKVEPVPAAAVRVTEVPDAYEALQVLPQLIPLGEEVTVPVPVPLLVRVRVYGLRAKVAVRLVLALTTRAQVPVPVQPPLQPVKVEPVAAVALRARLVPLAALVLHVVPQLMPAGLEATVPLPAPALPTETV